MPAIVFTLQSDQIRRVGLLCFTEPVDGLLVLLFRVLQLVLGSQGVKVLAKATLGTVLLFGIASCSEPLEHAVLVGVSEHLTEVFS